MTYCLFFIYNIKWFFARFGLYRNFFKFFFFFKHFFHGSGFDPPKSRGKLHPLTPFSYQTLHQHYCIGSLHHTVNRTNTNPQHFFLLFYNNFSFSWVGFPDKQK